MPGFDPSKMDPKVLMELSRLIQQLPPSQLSQMQTLMHNMMAGLDVRQQMEEFEKSLPPGFREKLMSLMGGQMGAGADSNVIPLSQPQGQGQFQSVTSEKSSEPMDFQKARRTILRAVADGQMTPEDAEKLLFSDSN